MAQKKDKLIESAQKNLKKKQVSKAIKDYEKIVELDPADVRVRQKLAELYVRLDKTAEAYDQYESVAKYFSGNGFYLKATAIYRLMQRIDPSQIGIYHRLAELNQKQGLIGNAMAEYRNLVDYYERNGMVADEIKTLEKMHDLDQNNLNIRAKLAEMYARNERRDEGLSEFNAILEILVDKNNFDRALKLYKLFMPLYPDNRKLQSGLALVFCEKGDYQRAVTILAKLFKEEPNDLDLLRLLGKAYLGIPDWSEGFKSYQQLLQHDPTDLDSREALIRCQLGKQDYASALAELEEWKEAFFKVERLDFLRECYEALKEELPGERPVVETLDAIYQLTGEGGKILDMIETNPESDAAEEDSLTLADELLESVGTDLDERDDSDPQDLDLNGQGDELEFDIVGGDTVDLQLEMEPGEDDGQETGPAEDSFLELDLSEEPALSPENDPDTGGAAAKDQHPTERNQQADLEEAEFYFQQGLYDEAEELYRDILVYTPDSSGCQEKLEEINRQRQKASVNPEPDSSAERTDADLSNVAEASQGKVFKTDVDEQIGADDMESHYNLGIAYRDMGLYSDAIGEFDKAIKDQARYVDCQTLKGLCYADQDDFDNAEAMFLQALDAEYLEDVQRLNLGYELGLLYERATRWQQALASYRQVYATDRLYRDVGERIAMLQQQLGIAEDDVPAAEDSNKQRISFL